jgi:hypothetical protein
LRFLIDLLMIAMVLAGLAPTLIAGGRMIAAFMVRKLIGVHLLWTVLAAATLTGAAVGAAVLIESSDRLLAAVLLCGAPWVVHWLCLKYLVPRDSA